MYQTASGLWMLKCSQILSFLRYICVSNSTLGRQTKPAGHAHVNEWTNIKESWSLIKTTGTWNDILVTSVDKHEQKCFDLFVFHFFSPVSYSLCAGICPTIPSSLISVQESVKNFCLNFLWICFCSKFVQQLHFLIFIMSVHNGRWLALACLALRVPCSPGDATNYIYGCWRERRDKIIRTLWPL